MKYFSILYQKGLLNVQIKSRKKQKKSDDGYVNWWLFRDKGTVAEKRTIKELWNDPEVQKEIEAVRSTLKIQPDN